MIKRAGIHRLVGYSGGSCSSILPCSFCRTTRGNLQTFTSMSCLQPFEMREETTIVKQTGTTIVTINLLTISGGSCGGFGTPLGSASPPPPAVDCIGSPNLPHNQRQAFTKNNLCVEGRPPLFQLLEPCGFGTRWIVSARQGMRTKIPQ